MEGMLGAAAMSRRAPCVRGCRVFRAGTAFLLTGDGPEETGRPMHWAPIPDPSDRTDETEEHGDPQGQ